MTVRITIKHSGIPMKAVHDAVHRCSTALTNVMGISASISTHMTCSPEPGLSVRLMGMENERLPWISARRVLRVAADALRLAGWDIHRETAGIFFHARPISWHAMSSAHMRSRGTSPAQATAGDPPHVMVLAERATVFPPTFLRFLDSTGWSWTNWSARRWRTFMRTLYSTSDTQDATALRPVRMHIMDSMPDTQDAMVLTAGADVQGDRIEVSALPQRDPGPVAPEASSPLAALRELTAAIDAIHPDGRPVYGSPHIAADPRWARLMAAVQVARTAQEMPATEAIVRHAATPEYWWIEGYPDDECSPLELHEALEWHRDEIPEGEILRAYGCKEVVVKTVYVVKTPTAWIQADTYGAAAALTIEGEAE